MKLEEVTTYEQVCKLNGTSVDDLPNVSKMKDQRQARFLVETHKATEIVKALNNLDGPWEADHTDPGQIKYVPIVWIAKDKKAPSGFVFSCSYCGATDALAHLGSRLCFRSPEALFHALKQFEQTFIYFYM